jgi:hypothetical protein
MVENPGRFLDLPFSSGTENALTTNEEIHYAQFATE